MLLVIKIMYLFNYKIIDLFSELYSEFLSFERNYKILTLKT